MLGEPQYCDRDRGRRVPRDIDPREVSLARADINCKLQLGYLDVTVLRHEVGEVLLVVGTAPACRQVWRGMQYRHSQKEISSYLIVSLSVGGLVSMFTLPILSFKCRIEDYYALYTTVHYTLL
jgi:hypothetical protein